MQLRPLSVLLFLAAITVCSASDLNLWYDKPANRWEEALPIGNGRLGAMIFGGVTAEHLQLNENTLYSGYPGYRDLPLKINEDFAQVTGMIAQQQYLEAEKLITRKWLGAAQACYQPLGDLRVDFQHKAPATGYVRELNLTSAVSRVSYQADGVTFTRECFASHPDEVIVLRLSADKPGSLNFRVRLDSVHPTAKTTASAGEATLEMTGQVPGFVLRRTLDFVEKSDDMWKYPNLWDKSGKRLPGAKQVMYDGKGTLFDTRLKVQIQGGQVTSESNSLVVSNADEAVIVFSAASSFDGYDRSPTREGAVAFAGAKAEQWLQSADKLKFGELLDRHVRDYQSLFNRVSLNLGISGAQGALPTDQRIKRYSNTGDPALAALYFQFGRYVMISGSRAGGQPLNLQGIWNQEVIPPWAGAYTVNINAEMNYWPAEVANLSECHEPFLRFIRELSLDGRRVAHDMYDRHGWVAHHNTTIWREAQPVDGWASASFWCMTGGWLCQHLFEHYQFTGDQNFLRDSYPIMKGACEFFLDWLVDDGKGRLVTPVSNSPENRYVFTTADGKKGSGSITAGSTMDMGIVRDLFAKTIRASEILDTDAGFRTTLQTTTKKLLPYQIGANGRLQEWREDYADQEPAHRHVSHLFALFPSDQITVRGTPDLAAAAKRTLELRGDGGTGWSKAWKVNFWARLEDGDHAGKMLGELISKSTLPNMFDTHAPFQIDGNFGGASGLAEMLLQSQNGEIQLLPALPAAWPTGSVKGLRARGNFAVDMEWKEGRLTSTVIHSSGGNICKIRYGNLRRELKINQGASAQVDGSLK